MCWSLESGWSFTLGWLIFSGSADLQLTTGTVITKNLRGTSTSASQTSGRSENSYNNVLIFPLEILRLASICSLIASDRRFCVAVITENDQHFALLSPQWTRNVVNGQVPQASFLCPRQSKVHNHGGRENLQLSEEQRGYHLSASTPWCTHCFAIAYLRWIVIPVSASLWLSGKQEWTRHDPIVALTEFTSQWLFWLINNFSSPGLFRVSFDERAPVCSYETAVNGATGLVLCSIFSVV